MVFACLDGPPQPIRPEQCVDATSRFYKRLTCPHVALIRSLGCGADGIEPIDSAWPIEPGHRGKTTMGPHEGMYRGAIANEKNDPQLTRYKDPFIADNA